MSGDNVDSDGHADELLQQQHDNEYEQQQEDVDVDGDGNGDDDTEYVPYAETVDEKCDRLHADIANLHADINSYLKIFGNLEAFCHERAVDGCPVAQELIKDHFTWVD
jgi:hypothetical protein